jgi:hypothetical protein
MNPSGGHTTGLSPDAVSTAIDAVVWENYMREQQPEYLSARDGMFFKQSSANEMVYVWDEDSNVGAFRETGEQETITSDDTFIGNQKTARQRKWMKQIPVSFEAFKTDQAGVGKRTMIGTQIGDRARLTQDSGTILDTYGDAFSGAVSTTPDGQNAASNSHVLVKTGGTLDNLETGALDADKLWTVVQSLANQKAQDGELGSQLFEGIVIPFILLKTAKETLDSQLAPFSGENQINFFDTVYGRVRIAASPFLGSTYNSVSNANTSYHVVSSNVQACRRKLADLSTDLIPPTSTANDTYIERARYMESHFWMSWTGLVSSNGTA